MRESASDFHPDSEISVNRENQPTPSRSYAAMVLSALLPGLGQIYLQKTVKGFLLLVVFASAIGIFYINSHPVREWRDLLRFQPAASDTKTDGPDKTETDSDDSSIPIWTLDNGNTIMFRPSWILKITSSIQAIVCWLYAVSDGWRGKRNFRKQHFEED